ncbi:MAG: PAS domain S-box protein, partial [archaeon]|nr:PAS domain S-box protein [archaeon]
MNDLIFESIRAAILLILFVYLIKTGVHRKELCQQGWSLIILGFGLLLFASLMDITDNFESLNRFIVLGDTSMQAFLKKIVGFSCGFLFLTIGLIKWIPTITGFEGRRNLNDELKKQIHERNQSERALLESKEKHRLFFENAPIGMIYHDNKGVITDVNDAIITIFGSSRKKLVGLGIDEIHDKKFSKEVYRSLEGKPGYFEGEYISYSGKKAAYIKAVWMPIKQEDEIIAGVGIIEDITDRKKAEEFLVKSEERYRLIAENVGDIIWTTDMNFNFTYISPSVYPLRGYTVEEAMKQTLEEVVLPKSLEKIMKLFVKTLKLIESGDEEGLNPVEFEMQQFCKD